MKKIALTIVLAGILAACNSGKSADSNDKGAQVEIDSSKFTTIKFEEAKYDFGKVAAGEVVEHSYKFTNTGQFPLIITSATASCGCTVPSKPDKPIQPGETGEIMVKFNSEGRKGLQEKNITIVANTNPNITELRLFGEVQ
ncbi:DUF1573 domain-containing protein [Solitalea lacus]|uniref:DUF1573 domain-containing protein n=1 Tax=Solitalea lacus TaxID=2911172 RepID=UPI001EDAB696|nr:DUF1573 domain-containing protein [Solitalea lacus]UKJ06439.1 DUF1573 domain-containing protein [Solitalea lacus]